MKIQPSNLQKKIFQKHDELLQNPMMGAVAYGENKQVLFPHRLVYVGVSWRELEPQKGEYLFGELEEKFHFEYWKEKKCHIVFRFYMDVPSKMKHMDIPKWLYEEMEGDGTWYHHPEGQGFSPNYENKVLRRNHKRMMDALGERYGKDDRVAFIQLGSIGHWGEWHTCYLGSQYNMPSARMSTEYIKHYQKNFKNKFLQLRRPMKIYKQNNFGFYNDSFGDVESCQRFESWIQEGYVDHHTKVKHIPTKEVWRKQPMGGEFANFPGIQYLEKDNVETLLQWARQQHISWLGPSVPIYEMITEEQQEIMKKLFNHIGYRFRLIEATWPKKCTTCTTIRIQITLSNDGSAPFYQKWPLVLAVITKEEKLVVTKKVIQDISKILPGIHKVNIALRIPRGIEKQIYSLRLGIMNSESDEFEIEFANRESLGLHYIDIGSIEVY